MLDGRLDVGAVPTASTINTFTECAYDGGEIRIDRCWSLQEVNANDNIAPTGYALAA